MISTRTFELQLHVDVRAEHISNGTPEVCSLCPLALAIGDAVRAAGRDVVGHDPVMVLGDLVRVNLAGPIYTTGELPLTARAFIHNFDHGPMERCKPFRFVVYLRSMGVEFDAALRSGGS